MQYVNLGRSGLKVSEICLGTMTFGEEFGIGAPEAECRRIFDAFRAAGGNFLDTADIYNAGTSERMLGDFAAEDREALVIATKFSLSTARGDPNAGGNHRKNLVQSLEASLRRLATDYVDLYWVHGWDRMTPLDELMRALDDQVRAGRVLHLGISNAPAWVVASANTLAAERGLTPFTAMQLNYNLVERAVEADFIALAAAQQMAITAWSPLAGGLLTGKFSGEASPAGTRLAESPRAGRVLSDANLAVSEALSARARALGCSPAQLALAWLRQRTAHPPVVPIIGARSLAQLTDNLGAAGLRLDPQTLDALDALAPPAPQYPEGLLDSPFFQTMMFGDHRVAGGKSA